MHKNNFLIFVCLIICTLLFPVAIAQSSMQVNFFNQGTISYSQPSPPSSIKNLVKIPDNFVNEIDHWDYVVLDTSVYRSYPSSIRLDADYERGTREANCVWAAVKPGDHVVWKVWVKTSALANTLYTGGKIGIDFVVDFGRYIDGQRWSACDGLSRSFTWINGVWSSGTKNPSDYRYGPSGQTPEYFTGYPPVSQFLLPFGKDWTLLCIDTIIPDCYYLKGNGGIDYVAKTGNSNGLQISYIAPWIDARELTDGTVWFDDSELYINP